MKGMRKMDMAVVHINSTFQSCLIIVTDSKDRAICWNRADDEEEAIELSARKATEDLAKVLSERKIRNVVVQVKGFGHGRQAAIKGLESAGINITMIKDCTPIPHNACRPRRKRKKD